MRVVPVLMLGLAILVLVAGTLARRRIGRERQRPLSDEMVRGIEETGRVDYEPPEALDHDEIRTEEDEFWAQSWDEPEEL